jgi:hypothetical protein
MNKVRCVISCPVDTYSGYGARSRDFVKSLIKLKPTWDIKILSQKWGATRRGWLEDHSEVELSSRVISKLTYKPEIWIQVTIPNEFQPIGTYNIGVTAGIETTICDKSWIEGCNKMNLVITSSNHSAKVFSDTKYEIRNNSNQTIGRLELQKPVEVLFEGVDTSIYKEIKSNFNLKEIPEQFCYLVVGHWMQGDFGHDRKNIAYTIKSFLETFKNKTKAPALLLKVQHVNTSVTGRDRLLKSIEAIRNTVKGTHPNIYIVYGDLTDQEMNNLYNHPKVKALVSLTKGEGFGRPLLEFTTTGKPVIVSEWSGQLDFLRKEYNCLIPGTLENVHSSAVVKDMILKEAKWFKPDDSKTHNYLTDVFKTYKNYLISAEKQKEYTLDNFTLEHMERKLDEILSRYLPTFPELVEVDLSNLVLPKIK